MEESADTASAAASVVVTLSSVTVTVLVLDDACRAVLPAATIAVVRRHAVVAVTEKAATAECEKAKAAVSIMLLSFIFFFCGQWRGVQQETQRNNNGDYDVAVVVLCAVQIAVETGGETSVGSKNERSVDRPSTINVVSMS